MADNHDFVASERQILCTSLDAQREIIVWKTEGLSQESLKAPSPLSGLSVLALVKHLAWVEIWWFQTVFLGGADPWSGGDPDEDFRVEEHETDRGLLAAYRDAWTQSNQIISKAGFEDLSVMERRGSKRSLRWIITHMIEETARHAGHADMIREGIDGTRGYTREQPM